jgi:hypothetical protein
MPFLEGCPNGFVYNEEEEDEESPVHVQGSDDLQKYLD